MTIDKSTLARALAQAESYGTVTIPLPDGLRKQVLASASVIRGHAETQRQREMATLISFAAKAVQS